MQNNNYFITENEIQELENICSYFKYHNKNLTKGQDYLLFKLETITEHARDNFATSEVIKNDNYIKEI